MKNWIVPVLRISKIVAQVLLLVLSLFWFAFSLMSGAEEYGGGFRGILKNSPNAIPWLLLLVLNYFIYKFNLLGGILIFAFSWFCFFMFDVYDPEQIFVLLVIFLPLLLISLIFIGNGILNRWIALDTENGSSE